MIEHLETLLTHIPEPLKSILMAGIVMAGGWVVFKRYGADNSTVIADASSTALKTVMEAVDFNEKRIKQLEDEVSRIPGLERSYLELQLEHAKLQLDNSELKRHVIRLEAKLLHYKLVNNDFDVGDMSIMLNPT